MLRHARHATANHANIQTRAAHVAGDDVVDTKITRDGTRCSDPRRRPGEDRVGCKACGERRGHDATVGLHDEQFPGVPGVRQFPSQAIEVAADEGLDVTTDGRRTGALEFPQGRQDVRRNHDVVVGPELHRDIASLTFVFGIEIGMQEADDEHLAAGITQGNDFLAQSLRIERREHFTFRTDALGHLASVAPHDQRGEFAAETIGLGAITAPKFEHIPESLRGDQPAARTLAFDRRVCGHGGPMDQEINVFRGDAKRLDALQQANRLVLSRGGDFGHDERRSLRVDVDQIRVGSANVNAYIATHCSCSI